MARLGSFNSAIEKGINHGINREINIGLKNGINSGTRSRKLKAAKEAKPTASPLVWMPIWVYLESHFVRLNTKEEIELACKLACIHHNGAEDKIPFCDDDDWQFVSEKEAFLAGVRNEDIESESSSDER